MTCIEEVKCTVCKGSGQIVCQLCNGVGCYICHVGYFECQTCNGLRIIVEAKTSNCCKELK